MVPGDEAGAGAEAERVHVAPVAAPHLLPQLGQRAGPPQPRQPVPHPRPGHQPPRQLLLLDTGMEIVTRDA